MSDDNLYDDKDIHKVMNNFAVELDKIIDETVDEILANNKKRES